jgi:hypothetical protein
VYSQDSFQRSCQHHDTLEDADIFVAAEGGCGVDEMPTRFVIAAQDVQRIDF